MAVSLDKQEWTKLVETLAKLRDWLQHAEELRQSVDEFLNLTAQNEVAEADLTKIARINAEGGAGPYEKAVKQENRDYQLLVKVLGEHNGKMTIGGFFVWLFSDGETVGRKPSKSRKGK